MLRVYPKPACLKCNIYLALCEPFQKDRFNAHLASGTPIDECQATKLRLADHSEVYSFR